MQALSDSPASDTRIHLCGHWLVALPEGALWWPDTATLIVSDLHLEKGSSYAARGQMLPPYDTHRTLSGVERLCRALLPHRVISLGDSFHDRSAETRLDAACCERIRALTSAHDWLWVEGNHDPDPPAHLGGRAEKRVTLGALSLCHEPTGARGEIAGHLHPAARVRGRGRSVRRRCFASDGERLVMPAFGAFTGGLNVRDAAFASLFPGGLIAFMLGQDRVFAMASRKLLSDRQPASSWRL
ncbi:MAG: ligase-associated DNA damage response endonuclease PdeM [Alphaproteobacteria bacterium]|jgi:DNA ligase-associated metallophosphoesterase|nr:ligase-associated DNA damage response endonuclease PdeM [Alphaproteobacteria bacterium]